VEEVPQHDSTLEHASDGIVLLILGACAELLDQGPELSSAISERLVAQIHWLLAGLKEKR
jgi:hypothetical protein